MSTIRTLLLRAAEENPDGVAFRWKQDGQWQTLSHRERLETARAVAEIAGSLGVRPGDRVALMMENRVEWTTVYLGLACSAVTVVPVDAKLQPREVSHILRDSGASAIFAGGRRWPVLEEVVDDLPDLHHIILLDHAFEGSSKVHGKSRHDFDALLSAASASLAEARRPAFFDRNEPSEDTVASILYTSGTTGRPKGAMLTHGNFAAQIDGAFQCFTVRRDDNFFLVLPLHHAFAFTACFLAPLAAACETTMAENLRTIPADMLATRPSILLAVPLLAEKMLEAIMKKLRKNLAAMTMLRVGLGRVVGKKIVDNLGGRLRILICGGAASNIEMLRMYNRFGIHTIEGYGLTETAPICALTPESEIHLGTVGKALPGNELAIDEPNADGIGEILVRGPITMKGYFHNAAATAEVFSEGGWFHTGDLGRLNDEGYLTITGRKKSLIVNREGKNIYPEEVEQAIAAAPHILESLVVGFHEGDETGERVGVIAVPNMDLIAADFGGKQLTDNEVINLCKKEIHEAVSVIAEYKRPRGIRIRFEPFERTTTQKIKRYLYGFAAD